MQANYQPKIIDARKTRKSVQSLQDERNQLLKEIKDLKEINQFQKEAIEKYRVNHQTQYVELKFRWWFCMQEPIQCIVGSEPYLEQIKLSLCTFIWTFFSIRFQIRF